jgi:alkylhydroperoxidase family enzyme
MTMLLAFALALITACLGCLMGLWEAIATTLVRIVRCPRCSAFWGTAAAELYVGARDWLAVLALATLAAFLASWLAPALARITSKFSEKWDGWIK